MAETNATLVFLVIILFSKTIVSNCQQYSEEYYTEFDKNYGGRSKDILRGQFVPAELQQQLLPPPPQQQQQQQQ